ncbi:MAG: single-stranded-DNA-specific exonuclease RecJ [Gammaproteobacteria bacterium]|nr:single-stranded-DNA-specific exonuclease RecJ [Gammaproteobacteria bacterium]
METDARRVLRRALPELDGLAADIHPVLARIYAARQVRSPQELDHSLERLLPPHGLKHIERAAALLADAITGNKHLLIVADFDADGATSCALAVRALRALGAQDVRYVVPNRFEYGYGLTPEIVAVAARQQPDLLITVDNGITSIEGVQAAHERGIQVLVTDHHLAGAALPAADAIVNPNQPGDDFASKNLAGVGVIFYVMLAVRAALRERGWFDAAGLAVPNLARFLDLVALGTVADVVPLDHNNRVLVAQGLKRLNQGQGNSGILALLAVGGREPGRLAASDLGFIAGPRLNAAGRLDDMALGIECLLSDDPADARAKASRLDALNRERRGIEAGMQQQALAALAALKLSETDTSLPRGLCLFDESWHQGVIGILAARIKDRLHRPVIAFAPAGGDELKGSARSVAGLHIRDALEACATRHPQLLQKFGGHAMAAGLSLRRADFAAFSAAFDAEVCRHLDEADLHGRLWTDGELAADDLALDFAETLRHAGPWGQGFPEPLFDGRFEVVGTRVVGEKHLKLTLRHPQGRLVDAIAFNQANTAAAGQLLHAAYRLTVNEYQGSRSVQLIVEQLTKL